MFFVIEYPSLLVVANSITHCSVGFSSSPGSPPFSLAPTSRNHMPIGGLHVSLCLRFGCLGSQDKIPCAEVHSGRSEINGKEHKKLEFYEHSCFSL